MLGTVIAQRGISMQQARMLELRYRMDPLPTIDSKKCTGCHRCVDLCPTQALAQVAGKAFLAYPDRCTYCTACEDVCPENAIALPFLIVMAPAPAAGFVNRHSSTHTHPQKETPQ